MMKETVGCDGYVWKVEHCPDCGSTKVEVFIYKEGTVEVRNLRCGDCGNSWQERVKSFGC